VNFTEELRDAITKRAVFLVLGVLGLQVLFIISYVGALHSPSPSRVPFGLVAPAPVAGPLSSRLNGLPGQPLSVSVTGTAAQARSDVLNRDVYGALVVSPATVAPRDTLYVASGGGAALSNVLKGLIGAAEARQHRSLAVVPCDDESRHNTVAEVVAVGFVERDTGRIRRPVQARVHQYSPLTVR